MYVFHNASDYLQARLIEVHIVRNQIVQQFVQCAVTHVELGWYNSIQ